MRKLAVKGIKLEDYVSPCSYLEGRTSIIESVLIHFFDHLSLEGLLENGYRHFGNYFFRPVCRECHQCIPIRIPVKAFRFSKSARRLFKRNERLTVNLDRPVLYLEAYNLYRKHLNRFSDNGQQSYDEFIKSFYYPSPSAYQMSIHDGNKLVAVSHLDITPHTTSAVYSYYDDEYYAESLGTFLIYKALELSQRLKQDYFYLGYYVPENRHMNYKLRFRPNQLLVKEHYWLDYLGENGGILNPDLTDLGFVPVTRLNETAIL